MTTTTSLSPSSAHPTNFRLLRGRHAIPALGYLWGDPDAGVTAAEFGGLAPGYVYTRQEKRDILGRFPTMCIIVLMPTGTMCTWHVFYSRTRFEAFLRAYDLTLDGDLAPGSSFLIRLPQDASRWLPIEKVPWTLLANGRTFCGDDLDAFGYCGKPFVRGCDHHDELWTVHNEPHELERIRNKARGVAYSGPGNPPLLTQADSAPMRALFEALFAARRFMRDVERPFPGRGPLSESAIAMYDQARDVANRAIEELDRRGIPTEERCPDCDASDGLHAGACPRPRCPDCGPHTALAGVRYPIPVEGHPRLAGIQRCTRCSLFERDTDAAAALAEARGTDYTVINLCGGGQPYLPKQAKGRAAAASGR